MGEFASKFIGMLSQFQRLEDKILCEICKPIFSSNDELALSKLDPGQKIQFDCVSRLRTRSSCRLCVIISQRVEDLSECKCSNSDGPCLSLQRTYRKDEFEWLIFYGDTFKGSIVRHNRKKLKELNIEPVCHYFLSTLRSRGLRFQ